MTPVATRTDAKSPEFVWRNGRYHFKSGDTVPWRSINSLSRSLVKEAEAELTQLANLLLRKRLSFEEFQASATRILRELSLTQAKLGNPVDEDNTFFAPFWETQTAFLAVMFAQLALGSAIANGVDEFDARNSLQIARDNATFLARRYGLPEPPARKTADNGLTNKQLLARLRRYARASTQLYMDGRRKAAIARGAVTEQRTLGMCEPHCQPCKDYARMGRVKAGSLPLPTEKCDCRENCCCTLSLYNSQNHLVSVVRNR